MYPIMLSHEHKTFNTIKVCLVHISCHILKHSCSYHFIMMIVLECKGNYLLKTKLCHLIKQN